MSPMTTYMAVASAPVTSRVSVTTANINALTPFYASLSSYLYLPALYSASLFNARYVRKASSIPGGPITTGALPKDIECSAPTGGDFT